MNNDGTATGRRKEVNGSKSPSTGPAAISPDKINTVLHEEDRDIVVALNVGGCKFTTSRSSLCRVPGSYLEAMFSGRHAVPACQESDGSFFIDRDGSHFRHVLNFLRVGAVATLPDTHKGQEELAIEADFYGLDDLVRAIRMPKIDVFEHLSEDTRKIWEDESKLRSFFIKGELPSTDPFYGLVPLFRHDNGMESSLPLTFDPDSPRRHKAHLFLENIPPNPKPSNGVPVTVKNLQEFRTNFNREWPNVLHRLQEVLLHEPVIIAGGAVLQALTKSKEGVTRTGGWWDYHGAKSDIDVFLYCRDRGEANCIVRRIYYALAVDNEKWAIIRSRGVVNIHQFLDDLGVETVVQIVLRLYESPTEVLVGFDVDCCCCAFDGKDVWLSPRCISALQSGVNVLNPLHAWPNRASYEFRLNKYAARGYAVSVPGVDLQRIDYMSIQKSKLENLKGLARFIKMANLVETAPPITTRNFLHEERRWETIEIPQSPRSLSNLREEAFRSDSTDERLVHRRVPYRDQVYDSVADIIVPSVFPDPEYINWAYEDDFQLAIQTRDQAWEEILDAGESENRPTSLARRLFDAWESEKRSREYLNASVDPYDLNNIYYSHAFFKDSASGN